MGHQQLSVSSNECPSEDYLVWVHGNHSLVLACLGTESIRKARRIQKCDSMRPLPFWVEKTCLKEGLNGGHQEKIARIDHDFSLERIYGLSPTVDGRSFLVSDFSNSYQVENK